MKSRSEMEMYVGFAKNAKWKQAVRQMQKGENTMYEYTKGDYVYYGNKECGSPVREIKTISQKEADYWDRLEREIRRQERMKR